jgi:hypothetical protein
MPPERRCPLYADILQGGDTWAGMLLLDSASPVESHWGKLLGMLRCERPGSPQRTLTYA